MRREHMLRLINIASTGSNIEAIMAIYTLNSMYNDYNWKESLCKRAGWQYRSKQLVFYGDGFILVCGSAGYYSLRRESDILLTEPRTLRFYL